MNSLADVAAWRARCATLEFSEAHPGISIEPHADRPTLRDHVTDALRVENLRALVASAANPTDAPAAAAARMALRICIPAYLDAQAPDLEERCRAQRRSASALWAGDVDAALAQEADPARRRALDADFRDACDRLARGESERLAARDEGARRIGASDARSLRRCARAPGAPEAADEVERGFIAPLDDAVARAVQERWRALRGRVPDAPERCDVPVMSRLTDRRPLFPARHVNGVLRRLGAALRLDPDAGGCRIETLAPAPANTEVHESIAPRAIIVVGSWGGPAGLADALDAFGRAARATFLMAVRGPDAPWRVDPAYAMSAATLFRRIAESPMGPLFASNPNDEARGELRLETLIAARRAWDALRAENDAPEAARLASLRAGGRPLAPGEAEVAERDEEDAWGRLRGLIFGLLVEERLLSRFGWAWFTLPEAGSLLRELWASEPDGDAGSMASALGLGTMDSAPLLEAFRLGKGRAA